MQWVHALVDLQSYPCCLCVSVCMFTRMTVCARYPPGHGDLYNALWSSGVLDSLLHDGKVGRQLPD